MTTPGAIRLCSELLGTTPGLTPVSEKRKLRPQILSILEAHYIDDSCALGRVCFKVLGFLMFLCMRSMHAYYACVACMRICYVCIQAAPQPEQTTALARQTEINNFFNFAIKSL